MLKVGNSAALKSMNATPTAYVSANGSTSRITKASDYQLDFEVTEAANYILRWQVAKATTGLNEALLGSVRLVCHETTGIDTVVDLPLADGTIYDLSGRCVDNTNKPGIYIRGGKKVIVR